MRTSTLFIWMSLTAAAAGAQELEMLSDPQVRFVTNRGAFVVELDGDRAPLTVENFVSYVREGHYEGTVFHRVIQGFIAQAGGFTANLQEKGAERDVVNESGNGLSNLRGTIGLARANEPHSGNAQFYINLADNLDLNPRPTRWGLYGVRDDRRRHGSRRRNRARSHRTRRELRAQRADADHRDRTRRDPIRIGIDDHSVHLRPPPGLGAARWRPAVPRVRRARRPAGRGRCSSSAISSRSGSETMTPIPATARSSKRWRR